MAAAGAALLAALALGPALAQNKQPPHLIFVMGDDAGWNDFGFTRGLLAPESELTGPQAKTPTLDALAKAGVVLKRTYAYRYCSPSRGSLLSGRLPFHAHEANPGISSPGCLNLNYTLLPAKLREAGYLSHQVGKWHEGMESLACVPVHRGFNSSYGYLSGAEDHVDQSAATGICRNTPRKCSDAAGGCIDLWRNERAAHGENGTYNDYAFVREFERIVAQHPKDRPLFVYQAFQK